MLKWTVMNKRDSNVGTSGTNGPQTPVTALRAAGSYTNRRRSADAVQRRRRRSSLCAPGKENRRSAPRVATPATPSLCTQPFRDVSNLTPQSPTAVTTTSTSSTSHPRQRRKKQCVQSHFMCDSDPQPPKTIYASTLPSFQMEYSPCLRDTMNIKNDLPYSLLPQLKPYSNLKLDDNCSPNKKPKIDHVTDFLHQISYITSPEDFKLNNIRQENIPEITVSPLLQKIVDLKFNKKHCDTVEEADNSSAFNDMSLDKIVDAILDTTLESNQLQPNSSKDLKNIKTSSPTRNCFEETQKRKRLTNSFSEDCTKKLNLEKEYIFEEIPVHFNERLVQTPDDDQVTQTNKRYHDDSSSDFVNESFCLKRQRCIRRRRPFSSLNAINNNACEDYLNVTPTSAFQDYLTNEISNDTSFSSSSCVSASKSAQLECYSPWKKEICCGLSTPSLTNSKNEGSFKISTSVATSSTPTAFKDSVIANGSIEVQLNCNKGILNVNVVRCTGLQRPNGGSINAYVKVALIPEPESRSKKRTGPQRTAVQAESNKPRFDHRFSFRLSKLDLTKRVLMEVWHRDRSQRRSEFLGCMSFPVKHAVKKEINGTYKLQSSTRSRNHSSNQKQYHHHQQQQQQQPQQQSGVTMCENSQSQSSCEEVLSVEEATSVNLAAQQRDADENLFLRYLELDPVDGPEAGCAALQRRASGHKGGRTPFTTTKRLTRASSHGFGFSVVWTHPPRVERVERGLPADKAGILPGDYIIFVDKHNVVMMPEIDILNLIRSFGNQLTLEIFRRSISKNGGVSLPMTRAAPGVGTHGAVNGSDATFPSVTFQPMHRPSTGCSTNTTSVEFNRRRLHLPQVTFTSEKTPATPEEARRRAMYQLINKEQQYVTALQFAVTRFVSALAERRDLLTSHEHRVLFQNSEEILRITEDILETLIQDDGEPQLQLLPKIYELKLSEITSAYKKYCAGLKRADYLLATKTKNSNSDFVRFLQQPAIPRRRPDITSFIHKPLEHYRDILKLFTTILSHMKSNLEGYSSISRVVHEMQVVYREITAEAGLMEPVGEGRPLLSVQDLENRLVFTKCKPFVLSKPGRQWIFGGDLSRVEGRTIRTYWALLFSDLLLFAKVSRDRVLFITEEPLPLSHITEIYFNVRKKATEFRMTVEAGGRTAQSPTAHCGPDLTRTPRKNASRRSVVLRAPTMELKAVWQNLLQRQLFHVNSGVDGSSLSSPLESPEVPITSSVGTLQSAESLRQGQRRVNSSMSSEMQKHIDELIEHKCKQLSKSTINKGGAIHLEQWMKGQLGTRRLLDEPDSEPEPEPEFWTAEELRKRSEELQLVDVNNDNRNEDQPLSDHDRSPSRSTTTGSQVTVRSSPVVPEQVSVCKQCHETCLSNNNSPNLNIHHTNNNVIHNKCPNNINAKTNKPFENNVHAKTDNENNSEWGSLMLMGLAAINPTTSFVKLDPFAPKIVPKIAVVPPTPEQKTVNNSFSGKFTYCNDVSNSPLKRKILTNLDLVKDYEDSPDDSPQNEHPYISLDNCNQALRRFGTLSSLEKLTSDDFSETLKNSSSDSEDDENDSTKTDPGQIAFTSSLKNWTAKAGSYVSEKMAFFEKLADDSREGFFERYLKQNTTKINEDGNIAYEDECETSGATSGEEIWGTPTSGGELEDPLTFPNSDGGNLSPQSMNSLGGEDDTELMMDELLMAPPMSASIVRGLLPRRRLEPLLEEEDSDTYTTSSSSSEEKATPSPEEGNGTGAVADDCSAAPESTRSPSPVHEPVAAPAPNTSPVECTNLPLVRSRSYRHIIEEVESRTLRTPPQPLLVNFPVVTKYKSIEPVRPITAPANAAAARPKTTRLFDFFSARRSERRIHESFSGGKQLLRVFSKDSSIPESPPNEMTQKPLSPMLNKDKQMDRRFWRQLSKRRRSNRIPQIPA